MVLEPNQANANPVDGVQQVNYKANVSSIFENRDDCEWLTTKEAAQFIRVSPNALTIMVHRGQIPVFKFGRRLRFRVRDLEALFLRKGA